MRQQLLGVVTALAFCLTLAIACVPTAFAHSDVSDPIAAEAVDILSGMGIVEGYSDGTYRPNEALTRAQFCKLAISLAKKEDQAAASAYRTLFSDLPASHWAVGYINLAYGEGLVSGYGNGRFGPEDSITAAQAITVILHVLGYQNEDIGPFWPEDYLAKAAKLGLTTDLSLSAGDPLTRGQAAQLLYNTLAATEATGKIYYTLWANTTVLDVVLMDTNAVSEDGRTGTAQVYLNGAILWYEQKSGLCSNLEGRRGTLLLDSQGAVIGFLPDTRTYQTLSLVKVAADGLTDAIGGMYTLSAQIKVFSSTLCGNYAELWYDLEASENAIVYYNSSGSIDLVYVPDGGRTAGTLLTGIYENAVPNTTAPSQITLLGMTLDVAEEATASLGRFTIGSSITVMLDGAGQVTTAYDSAEKKTDLIGVLESVTGETAKVRLLCGLTATGTVVGTTPSERVGGLVKVTAAIAGKLNLSALSGSAATGSWNVASRTLGKVSVADNVRVFDQVKGVAAVEIELNDLPLDTIPATAITYVGKNSTGLVDLIVLDDVTGDCYTYGFLKTGIQTSGSGDMISSNNTIAVKSSSGTTQSGITSMSLKDDSLGGIVVLPNGKLGGMVTLTKAEGVTRSDFSGSNAVLADGYFLSISTSVEVYQSKTAQWTTLEAAKAYSDTFSVYYDKTPAEGGKVRLIIIE